MESEKNENKNKDIKNESNNKNNDNNSSGGNNLSNKQNISKEKDKKFLNKKHFKNKSKSKNKNKNFKKNNFQHRKLEPIEQLYQKAKNLYEKKTISYDLDKIDYNQKVNKEKRWTHDILQKGTYDDKISALLLYIRQSPKMTLKYLEILIRLAENKNKRKNDAIIVGLKDLFLEIILDNKKYLPFNQKYNNKNKEILKDIDDEELINSYYDDKIHHLYLRFINLLEESVNTESITNIKKKNLDYLYEMLVKQPESEEKILQDIVNKLGDTSTDISNHTMKLLKQIQEQHMNMSTIIFKYVTTFYTMNTKNEAKLNSLNYLVQMEIPHGKNKEFLEESINFFFNLFNQISSDSDTKINNNIINEKNLKTEKNKKKQKKLKKLILEGKNQNTINEKFLSLIVKRINILFKYVKNQQKQMEKINEIIHEKISVLFRLSHNKSLKLSIEILKLLFGIITTQDQNFVDRYYKSLYELISNSSLSSSKYVKEALKLILMSIMFDNNNNRVCSFIKRLLEMSLISEPQYIICVLIIISQVIRNKNKLWKMLEREQTKNNVFYDPVKRDPQYAQGEYSFLNELYLLQNHYHPSVQRMAKFILENYNKEIISYDGDPLMDFSLINFLEKFMLKNPKIKKLKKETKIVENDDDELKKFLKGDEENENNNRQNENEGEKNENDFEFIEKFNKIYPEITSDKNYIKKLKKKEKKMKNEEDIDDAIGDENFGEGKEDEEMEKYADKVVDEEYKRFAKDIDDDDLGDYQDEDNEEDEKGNKDGEEKEKEDDEEENEKNEEGEKEDDMDEDDEEIEEIEDLLTEEENEEDNEDDIGDGEDDINEEEELEEEKNNNDKKNKNKKREKKKSDFVDADTYYKNLKNKKKKIK